MAITISGSTGVAGVDGSASTPALQGTDTNTGIVFPAADTVTVATGGTERMRVDSSGNVGIGTSSPSYKLSVSNDISAANYLILSSATTDAATYGFSNSNGPCIQMFGSAAVGSGSLIFNTAGAERSRINSSGDFLIGTTTSSGKLTVNGAIAVTGAAGTYSVDSSSNQGNVANNGTIDFPNFSGILIINNSSNGSVFVYACGGGGAGSVGGQGAFQGTVTYVPGIAGYRYTNNSGGTLGIGIMALRTRNTA